MVGITLFLNVNSFLKLKRFRIYDIGKDSIEYFDENYIKSMWKDKEESYFELNNFLYELLNDKTKKFKLNLSIQGIAFEEIKRYAPELANSFKKFSVLPNVEFVLEPYYNSLSMIYSKNEFLDQIREQKKFLLKEFCAKPNLMKSPELIYSDEISEIISNEFPEINSFLISDLAIFSGNRFKVSCNLFKNRFNKILFLRNNFFSKSILDIKNVIELNEFLDRVISVPQPIINLSVDYNKIISQNFNYFKDFIIKSLDFVNYLNVRDVLNELQKTNSRFLFNEDLRVLKLDSLISKDDSLVLKKLFKNRLQESAQEELYLLEKSFKNFLSFLSNDFKFKNSKLNQLEECYSGLKKIFKAWRYLTNVRNFYYMNTEGTFKGEIENIYPNPYDSYVYFMNILNDMMLKIKIYEEKLGVSEKFSKFEPVSNFKNYEIENYKNNHYLEEADSNDGLDEMDSLKKSILKG